MDNAAQSVPGQSRLSVAVERITAYRERLAAAQLNTWELFRFGGKGAGAERSPSVIPPVLVQFWDRVPPEEIGKLFAHNAQICKQSSLRHMVVDDVWAADFIRSNYGAEAEELYHACEHPAMRCDMFRVMYLAVEGGMYLDADVVLKRPVAISRIKGPLFIQRTNKPVQNILNWFLAAPPRHPLYQAMGRRLISNLSANRGSNGRISVEKVRMTSGPGVVTKAVGDYLAGIEPAACDVVIVDHTVKAALTAHGPTVLGSALQYKSDERHWRKAT